MVEAPVFHHQDDDVPDILDRARSHVGRNRKCLSNGGRKGRRQPAPRTQNFPPVQLHHL